MPGYDNLIAMRRAAIKADSGDLGVIHDILVNLILQEPKFGRFEPRLVTEQVAAVMVDHLTWYELLTSVTWGVADTVWRDALYKRLKEEGFPYQVNVALAETRTKHATPTVEINTPIEAPSYEQAAYAWRKIREHQRNIERLGKYRSLTPAMKYDLDNAHKWASIHLETVRNYFEPKPANNKD